MPHNLSTFTDADGRTRHCCLSLRESPWHGLGRVIQQPVGSSEAIRLAGLDWTVGLRGLYTTDMTPVLDHRAVVRSDTNAVLGIVTDRYQPVQNREIFEWFDALAGTAPLVYETAGALGKGETVWVLARMPEEIRIGADVTRTYLLAYSGHASNHLLTLAPTGVRVVCQNTLRLAAAGISGRRRARSLEAGFRIRHTSGVRRAMDEVADVYRQTQTSITATRAAYEHLARVQMTEAMIAAMLERAFRSDRIAVSEADRAASIRAAREERIRTILASPTCTGEGVNGSAFALLNAVTEFVDHLRPTRTREGQASVTQRFASAHWGSGAVIKEAAFETIIELAHA